MTFPNHSEPPRPRGRRPAAWARAAAPVAALALPCLLLAEPAWAQASPSAARPAAASAPAGSRLAAARFYEDALVRYEKKDFKGAVLQLKNALQIDAAQLPVQVLLGKVLLDSGDVVGAEVALGEALRLGVDRAEVVLPLAQSMINQGKQQSLLTDARFALAGLPPKVQAQLLLVRAGAAADVGDTRSALRLVDDARALLPRAPDSWLAEAPIRIRAGQLSEAREAAERALALAPQDAEAHYMAGQVAHVSGDTKAALDAYERALKARGTHVEALVSRAGLLLDTGRVDAAAKDLQTLRETAPEDPRGAYLRALVHERKRETRAARDAYAEVTNLLDPVPPEFLRYRPQLLMLGGLSHYALLEFEKARPYLERVQRLQPASPVAKVLAQVHLQAKDTERAVEVLETYSRLVPNDTQATLLLGSALMSQGRYSRAVQLMRDAQQRQDDPALQSLLGMGLMGGGKHAQAAAALEASLKKDPRQVQAGTALLALYLKSGQAARAVQLAESLLKSHPNHPGLLVLLGDARLADGRHDAARSAYEQVLKAEPANGAAVLGLARAEAAGGAMPAAITRLEALVAAEPRNADAHLELAALLERSGRPAPVQRLLEKADDLAGPGNVHPALALVDFHLRQRQADAARQALLRAQNKAPDTVPVILAGARVAIAAGDGPSARAQLQRAAGLAGYDAASLVRVALLQMQAGHAEGANHTLDKALAERPDDPIALALKAELDLRRGDLVSAEQRARRVLALQPKSGVGHGLLGDIALGAGQRAAALEHFRRALEASPGTDNLMRLVRVQMRDDPSGAVRQLEAWLKRRPGDTVAWRALGDAHARAGQMAAARAAYEALLKQSPDDVEALNNLANVLVAMREPAAALATAERALALGPQLAHVVGTTGWAAHQAGQTERGLQLLRDARLRDPTNPQTRYYLAVVLAQAGRASEAKAELDEAIKADPSLAAGPEAEALRRSLR